MTSAKKSQDPSAQPAGEIDDRSEFQATGTGAASALERMKVENALRHKRQHGQRTSGPGHEEDSSPKH